ncbi:MAG: YdcF family protein [Actinomycetota bacterium]
MFLIGVEGFEESDVMRSFLVSRNVPESNIILDRDGSNTYKTAINTKQIMQAQNMRSVIIVSQYFHITRLRFAFQKAGIENIYAAHANYFAAARYLFDFARVYGVLCIFDGRQIVNRAAAKLMRICNFF